MKKYEIYKNDKMMQYLRLITCPHDMYNEKQINLALVKDGLLKFRKFRRFFF